MYTLTYAHAHCNPRACRLSLASVMSFSVSGSGSSGGISRARELLTQAVQFLECSNSRRIPPESATVPTARLGTRPLMPQFESRGRLHQFGQGGQSRASDRQSSVLAERNLLFNYGGKRRAATGGESAGKKEVSVVCTIGFCVSVHLRVFQICEHSRNCRPEDSLQARGVRMRVRKRMHDFNVQM